MPETHLILIACLFLVISYLCSSVGLGGGSSYTAVMAAASVSPLAIPVISLTLNLIVTSVTGYNYIRHRHASWRLILPFLISSLPMAYLGGSLELPKTVFYSVLFISLLAVVIRIFFCQQITISLKLGKQSQLLVCLIIGGLLGFAAGVVGIGGGIYLVPIIILLGLGTEKQAAASGAIFIWLNSAIGLIARSQHHSVQLLEYLPLIIAVLVGGTLGSFMGATRLQPATMHKILGGIIVIALCLLTRKIF